MTAKIQRAAWMQRPQTQRLVSAFAQSGAQMRFVGGCVRDTLLGKETQDVDIATPVLPGDVMVLLARAAIKAIPTGIAHGTVTAVVDGACFEITTLRRDTMCDGRHAAVAYTDRWQEDAMRRDFTFNALYASPGGEMFDYFGGADDLAARRVVFIGDPRQRIAEDALRILRYFRFLAQIDVRKEESLHAPSFEACAALAANIRTLSGERIRQEMIKLFALPALSGTIFEWMRRAHALPETLPEGGALSMDAISHAEHAMGLAPDALRRLCLYIPPRDTQAALAFLRERWKLPNAGYDRLRRYVASPGLDAATTVHDQQRLLRRIGQTLFTDKTVEAWVRSGLPDQAATRAFLPMLRLAREWKIPVFPVTGEDLLALGHSQGKPLGDTLKTLERTWEESQYLMNKEDLLKKV